MKKRLLRLFLLSGTLIVLLSACEYDFIVPTPPATPPPVGDTISFSQDVQPIFNTKCNSCHTNINPILTSARAYSTLVPDHVIAGSPETSSLYLVCKPGGSMSSYTSAANLDLIKRWIYAGAKND